MIDLTHEEKEILFQEYEKYLAAHHRWYWKTPLLSFGDWWREAADNAKDRAKYD